jgi:hypothetical protein
MFPPILPSPIIAICMGGRGYAADFVSTAETLGRVRPYDTEGRSTGFKRRHGSVQPNNLSRA